MPEVEIRKTEREVCNIFLDELTEEAQKVVAEFLGYETVKEAIEKGELDQYPIAEIEKPGKD